MDLHPKYEPEFDSLRTLLLDMARERSVTALPEMITRHLTKRAHVALARVWLLDRGDSCAECAMRSLCRDPSSCLHLVASTGRPEIGGPSWGQLETRHRRIPVGAADPGLVVSTGKSLYVFNTADDRDWVARNPWAPEKGIVGAAFKAIRFDGNVLGVIGIYSRMPLDQIREGGIWVSIVANQAAFAITSKRALRQVERLKAQLELENEYLREEIDRARSFSDLIGGSPALLNVLRQVELVAPTDASVLILGESGTGKELVAREIHRQSSRKNWPMIKVNCAAIPSELYESEFFGHVRGAFTGAVQDRAGRFQAADGGTLFLDEVGEIPLRVQGKLLRVLQEGTYERIGEERTRNVNVRIVAATNRDLGQDAQSGRFRADLYYRLNVFPIEIVPLRQRKEDIPLLAEHFLALSARKMNVAPPRLSRANVLHLSAYGWPGNVRELQNVLERALITSRSGKLRFDLPDRAEANYGPARSSGFDAASVKRNGVLSEIEVQQKIRENIALALRLCGGRIYGPSGAAALLRVRPTTLISRIKKLNIPVVQTRQG